MAAQLDSSIQLACRHRIHFPEHIICCRCIICGRQRDEGVGEAKIASILSGLVFGAISYMYNETLVELAGELAHYEIPLFAVLEGAPFPIFIFMTAVLCVAIYTTTISSILGLSSRFLSFVNWPRWVIVILLLSIMAPFTSIGFSNLIAFYIQFTDY